MSPRASIFTVPDDADCSWSSSSIGRNSDVVSDASSAGDNDESEVQSSFKGPLDTMDVLEEVLPIKQGISKFYNGKSKSFTSLADISDASSSSKDLAKPKTPLNKKRKNLIANRNFEDESLSFPPKIKSCEIPKRAGNFSRGALTDGVTDSNTNTLSASCCLPPLHPQVKEPPSFDSAPEAPRRGTPWRSFSLSDLQSVVDEIPNTSGGIS